MQGFTGGKHPGSIGGRNTDSLNAFISFCRQEDAKDGVLSGISFGIKDNIAVKGERLTCASRYLANYVAPYDATVVSRLRAEGAVIAGKTNLDEFACGSSGENSAFGPTLNPLFPGKVPGGSSSGSGAAVASGIVDAAFGSDTGGSARCPAAFCNLAALKPTYGRISRHGLVDMSMSLETPAPIVPEGRTELLASVMDAVSGPDEHDQTTFGHSRTQCVKRLNDFEFQGADIAVPSNLLTLCSREVADAFSLSLSRLEKAGSRIHRFEFRNASMLLPAYYLIMYSEFSSAMQRFDGLKYGTRQGDSSSQEIALSSRSAFGREVRRRILLGTYITSLEGRSEWYARAQNARAEIREEMEGILSQHDMVVCPTMPVAPYSFGEKLADPLLMYATDVLTVTPNLCGVPAGCIPIGPGISIQFIGRKERDEEVLSAMHLFRGLS
ncbi:MAG: Asp-tRNA(Asn)/Glu-tRNA(Gln) amidotransferase subunit GatA [Thermoplasmata archaeon YP2-bin.285]|uniref:Asp-tRNA(Asn)/Glu-tRNA(Gln) amidotransferase subunit GatA n=1 Tax=Candidatus Sysuiplasma superficiale TaxID=2823368 RepID=A0A8J7YRB3_9ARCH|nr:Asp-tRNA(Asn)/Glu-tRNA(Gln) amidotransferase subunit GatA [Candidatus Sysuiplasma superficiale]